MKIGVFARTFQRPDFEGVLDAAAACGFKVIHMNMACAGLASMPEEIPAALASQVQRSLRDRGMSLCGISATFNAIHPDRSKIEKGLRGFEVIAKRAREMGSDFLSLCTGTRNPRSMWQYHPANSSGEAWQDLLETMERLLQIADEHDLRLGIEPETNNVVDSAENARRLLGELRSERLRVIMDPANLFQPGDKDKMGAMLRNAFNLLGPRIAQAHAKDLLFQDPIRHVAAGRGCLDYGLYIRLLRESGYTGPVVLHGLSEQEVPESVRYLEGRMEDPEALPAPPERFAEASRARGPTASQGVENDGKA